MESTNVGRFEGEKMAIINQLLDMSKGILPVALFLFFGYPIIWDTDFYVYWLALAVIKNHNFLFL